MVKLHILILTLLTYHKGYHISVADACMFMLFVHGALCFVFVTPVAIAALVRVALIGDANLLVHSLLVPISG